VTKPLDPDIKAMRAINRALAALPDDAHVQRVMEWTVARAAGKSWLTLPRLRWIFGDSNTESKPE
jgi:hypothetical protein